MDMDTQSDTQTETTRPISDDQELAKVLAGVSQEVNNLSFEETPPPVVAPVEKSDVTEEPISQPANSNINNKDETTQDENIYDLQIIKKDAINELRPLVDKLNLEPEEKFDTYLLLLRSTDDKTLIAPAHVAAQNIADETRRAQALLDIIKEIDYLSAPPQLEA